MSSRPPSPRRAARTVALMCLMALLVAVHAFPTAAADDAVGDDATGVDAADRGTQTADVASGEAESKPLIWHWSWDRGVKYDVEVPFDRYWIGPDQTPLTKLDIEQRLAFVGRIGGIVQVDVAGYGESEGLEDADSGIELRRFRFGTRGDFFLLAHVSYSVDVELVATNFQVGDVYLWWSDVPYIGSFKVGNFSPPMSLESVTSARDTVFMETGLPVEAFAPGRSAGGQIGGPQLDQRLTWALGVFRTLETPTVGDQSSEGGRLIGRLTWLPEDEPLAHRLTHLGASGSFLFAAEDVNYASRPESHLAPRFLDTGALRSAEQSIVAGAEIAQIRDRWLFMGEVLVADIQGDERATLWGSYASFSRFLSNDVQPWDRTAGRLGRFETPRPFSWSQRRFGSVRAGARLSFLDLSDGPVQGGQEINFTANLTWFLNHYLSFKVEYGFAAIRDRPNQGNLNFVQARFQFDCF